MYMLLHNLTLGEVDLMNRPWTSWPSRGCHLCIPFFFEDALLACWALMCDKLLIERFSLGSVQSFIGVKHYQNICTGTKIR